MKTEQTHKNAALKEKPIQQEVLAYTLHGNRYLNITYQCTLRCAFCPKFNGTWEVQGLDLRLRREPSAEEILTATGDPGPYNEIVFCGLGETTLRWDTMIEIATVLKLKGAKIRLNSDGLANLVHARDVTSEMHGLVDSLSVSMNAHNEILYNQHCRPKLDGSYQAMLEFVRLAKQHVPDVSVTAINGLQGVDIQACENIANELGVNFRRRELDIVG